MPQDLAQFGLGAALVALSLLDLLSTAISPRGAGPVATLALGAAGRARNGLAALGGSRLIDALTGPGSLVAIVAIWIALQWTGFALIFSSGSAVVQTTGEDPASVGDVFGYVGATLSTLGPGRLQATSAFWANVAVVCALIGMISLTLSATLLLNLVQTVVRSRAVALQLHAVDGRPDLALARELLSVVCAVRASPLAINFVARDAASCLPTQLIRLFDRLGNPAAGDADGLRTLRLVVEVMANGAEGDALSRARARCERWRVRAPDTAPSRSSDPASLVRKRR